MLVGMKKRIKNILNYKKHAAWIIAAACIIGILVAVCFLSNYTSNSSKSLSIKTESGYIVDNDKWTIQLIGLQYLNILRAYSLKIRITNNSDTDQDYQCSITSVNDCLVTSDSSVHLDSGQCTEVCLKLSEEQLGKAGISDIEVMSIRIATVHENLPPHPLVEYFFEIYDFE